MEKRIFIKNKRARFDYDLSDFYTAGIVLTGTEIKSVRLSKASLNEAYCYFANNELWIKNMNISAYADGSYNNHLPLRDRKLLLNKKELRKLEKDCQQPGFSIIPTALFINDRGLAKIEIALAKGKKLYDKRQSIRENEDKRKMAQARKLNY